MGSFAWLVLSFKLRVLDNWRVRLVAMLMNKCEIRLFTLLCVVVICSSRALQRWLSFQIWSPLSFPVFCMQNDVWMTLNLSRYYLEVVETTFKEISTKSINSKRWQNEAYCWSDVVMKYNWILLPYKQWIISKSMSENNFHVTTCKHLQIFSYLCVKLSQSKWFMMLSCINGRRTKWRWSSDALSWSQKRPQMQNRAICDPVLAVVAFCLEAWQPLQPTPLSCGWCVWLKGSYKVSFLVGDHIPLALPSV